jgi:hypothetical protein
MTSFVFTNAQTSPAAPQHTWEEHQVIVEIHYILPHTPDTWLFGLPQMLLLLTLGSLLPGHRLFLNFQCVFLPCTCNHWQPVVCYLLFTICIAVFSQLSSICVRFCILIRTSCCELWQPPFFQIVSRHHVVYNKFHFYNQ